MHPSTTFQAVLLIIFHQGRTAFSSVITVTAASHPAIANAPPPPSFYPHLAEHTPWPGQQSQLIK